MPDSPDRDTLIANLIRAGEIEVSGEGLDEIARYFDVEAFRFYGPDGFESGFRGLSDYFTSVRAAFSNRSIRRGIILVDGDLIACQTWIEGDFVAAFTQSPAGALSPNGARVVFDLMNLFRFDKEGRLIEEHVRLDNRSLLRQLGAEGR
jgi:predicted ester cyclase